MALIYGRLILKIRFLKPQKLVLQNDGNLVLLNTFDNAEWSTGTNGICGQG